MRRVLMVVLILPLLVFANWSINGPASDTTQFEFQIPTVVAINVANTNITWNFANIDNNANNPAFPPPSFPEYYEPSTPNTRHYQQIDYLVWGFGATSWNISIEADGSINPSCGINVSDIEFTEDAASPSWTALSTTAQDFESGNANTGGWQNVTQDYRVQITGDETQTASSTVDVIYTIQTQ